MSFFFQKENKNSIRNYVSTCLCKYVCKLKKKNRVVGSLVFLRQFKMPAANTN